MITLLKKAIRKGVSSAFMKIKIKELEPFDGTINENVFRNSCPDMK